MTSEYFGPPDPNNPQDDYGRGGQYYPPYQIVNGVRYKHVGSGIYQDPVTGEVGRLTNKQAGTTTNPLTGETITTPGGLAFDNLPGNFQPWNANGGGSGYPPEYMDPWYRQMQERQLQQKYQEMGFDADAARQRAQTDLITSRNSASVNLAQASGGIAAQAAEFAANPRDAVAELQYRNAVGGATPFGGAQSQGAFGDYQAGLGNKFQELFGGVAGDLANARDFISSIPPQEYFSGETRGQLGLPPTPAQSLIGAGGNALPPAPSMGQAAPQGAYGFGSGQQAMDFASQIKGASPQVLDALKKMAVPGAAMGGRFDIMPGMAASREEPGFSPSSSEGGLNMNLFEPSVVMGLDSGKIYATLAEPRPGGKRRGEQLIIKPLKSETKRDQEIEKSGKQAIQSLGVPGAAYGGSINAIPQASDFMDELRKSIRGLGGSGSGTGDFKTGLPDPRLLANAPAQQLEQDPDLYDYVRAGYSAQGISPRSLDAIIKKYSFQGPINNLPRVSYAGG